MKILDRHVATAVLVTTGVAFAFCLSLAVMLHLFTHVNDLARAAGAFNEAGFGLVTGLARYYAVTMPFNVVTFGPFAILLAGLWTVQRLRKDGELAAAQTSGVPLRRVLAGVLVPCIVVSLAVGWLKRDGLPRLSATRDRWEALFRGSNAVRVNGPFVIDDGTGLHVVMQSFDASTAVAHGMQLCLADDIGRGCDVAGAHYRGDGAAPLWEPLTPPVGDATLLAQTDLRPLDIAVTARGSHYLASDELDYVISRNPDRVDLRMLRFGRQTYPLTAIVLLLLGIPLTLRRSSGGTYAAAGLCFLMSVVYFTAESVLRGVSQREAWLDPAVAAWLPAALFGSVGLVAWRRL